MSNKVSRFIIWLLIFILFFLLFGLGVTLFQTRPSFSHSSANASEKKFIKWVDFDVTKEALQKAYEYDLSTVDSDVHLHWIELLAYLGAKYGGDFQRYKETDLNGLAEKLMNKEAALSELTADMKYYPYYLEAYTAVLGGLVGSYEIEERTDARTDALPPAAGSKKSGDAAQRHWVRKYGLIGFSPIAKGYEYQDYDDFGVSRSYGYRRQHLGHDMMGQTGTPIIAVESGYVEALGWNQYGGWRIGIRSFDRRRYYYYAHLRQNFPYNKSLKVGSKVTAGDVIGYLGHTGYSARENVNNIDTPHLHFGLQLIFDESQKEGNNEIWVDCYELVRFLSQNRCETVKNTETKEYRRVYGMRIPTSQKTPNSP